MKFIKDLSMLQIIPMVIGLIFLLALAVVIATTVMLRKDLIHEESLQLAGILWILTSAGSTRNGQARHFNT